MAFIAKNPMSIPEIDYTPTTPSNTLGIFAKKDGLYEINSLGDVRKIATLGTNTIKEIPESKIDELYFNNPSFVEDGVFLVTDDSIDGKYGRNQYFLITSTQTDRPNVKERDLDYLGSTTQYRFHYYGGIQSRKVISELSDGGLYVYNWTQWESIGSGGGNGDLDAHRNNEDENAQHLTAIEKENLQNRLTDIDSIIEEIERIDGDIDSVRGDIFQEGERLNRLTDEVYGLEDRVLVLEAIPKTEVPTTLEVNTAYNFGSQNAALTLTFPSIANDGDVIYIGFVCREGLNLVVDTTNTFDFDLVPEKDTGYEIYAKCTTNLGVLRWIVKYSEYSGVGE